MVGLRLGHHSPMALRTMVVQASTSSIPFAELSPHSRPLRISPQSQPQSSAWVCSPNPTFQHPEPLSAVVDTLSGWVGRAGVSTLCTRLTLCCCHRLLVCSLSTENEARLLSQLGSPSEGLSWIWRPDLSSDRPKVQVPLQFLSCYFSFFFFLSYLSTQKSFLTFSLSKAL